MMMTMTTTATTMGGKQHLMGCQTLKTAPPFLWHHHNYTGCFKIQQVPVQVQLVGTSLGTNSSIFANCSVFCDAQHVRSSVLGQSVMFESIRSSVLLLCDQTSLGTLAMARKQKYVWEPLLPATSSCP